MNRRNLFKFLGSLPLLGLVGIEAKSHPLLLEGVIKYQRAKYRWIAPGSLRDAVESGIYKNFPGFPRDDRYVVACPTTDGKTAWYCRDNEKAWWIDESDDSITIEFVKDEKNDHKR
jgi:hypothetical protein